MKFYAIDFGNYTTLIVSTDFSLEETFAAIREARGLIGPGGTIYNPNCFVKIYQMKFTDDRNERSAVSLENAILRG